VSGEYTRALQDIFSKMDKLQAGDGAIAELTARLHEMRATNTDLRKRLGSLTKERDEIIARFESTVAILSQTESNVARLEAKLKAVSPNCAGLWDEAAIVANAIHAGAGAAIKGTLMEADFRKALGLKDGQLVIFR
jgi:septal ring factor EnvC (AmiA/AmiB activator)